MPNKNYTYQERLEFFKKVAKKGSKKSDGTPYSDFYRGVAVGVLKEMTRNAKNYKKANPNFKTKQQKNEDLKRALELSKIDWLQ